jgi:hypothetical protein
LAKEKKEENPSAKEIELPSAPVEKEEILHG